MDAPAAEDDPHSTPMSLPESGDTGEGGKLKMIVQLVKKCLGVKDIASMFVSACYPALRAPAVHVLIAPLRKTGVSPFPHPCSSLSRTWNTGIT